MWFSLVFLGVIHAIHVCHVLASEYDIDCGGSNRFVVYGENLVLTCNISARLAAQHVDPSQFGFRLTNTDHQHPSSITIFGEFVHIENDTRLMLNYSNLPSHIKGPFLWFRPVVNGTHFTSRDDFRLRVGYRPKQPVITEYEVDNWDRFWFRSTLVGNPSDFDCEYYLWYKKSDDLDYTNCSSQKFHCPQNQSVTCSVPNPFDVAQDGMMILKVNASNPFGQVSSSEVIVQLHNIVRPHAVQNLQIDTSEELQKHSGVLLLFYPPHKKSIQYTILATCGNGKFNKTTDHFYEKDLSKITTGIYYPLTGLPAYSTCTASVQAMPSQRGLMGPWSHITFNTSEDIPLEAPEICTNCFQLVDRRNANVTDIIVYFRPLSDEAARGLVIGYRAHVVSRYLNKKFEYNASAITSDTPRIHVPAVVDQLNLDVENVNVQVDAKTCKGYNDTLDAHVIHIPRRADRPYPPKLLAVLDNDLSLVNCSWQPDKLAHSYTVVWCNKPLEESLCSGTFDWTELHANVTDFSVSLPPGADGRNFVFGIVLEDIHRNSSGINWTLCTFDPTSNDVAEPQLEVYTDSSNCHEMVVRMKRSDCVNDKRGYAMAYNLIYCPAADGEEIDPQCHNQRLASDKNGCLKKQVAASGYEVNVTLADLQPNKNYFLWAESLSARGSVSRCSGYRARTSRCALSATEIAFIAMGCLTLVILMGFGFYTIYRCHHRIVEKFHGWWNVIIYPPKENSVFFDQPCHNQNNHPCRDADFTPYDGLPELIVPLNCTRIDSIGSTEKPKVSVLDHPVSLTSNWNNERWVSLMSGLESMSDDPRRLLPRPSSVDDCSNVRSMFTTLGAVDGMWPAAGAYGQTAKHSGDRILPTLDSELDLQESGKHIVVAQDCTHEPSPMDSCAYARGHATSVLPFVSVPTGKACQIIADHPGDPGDCEPFFDVSVPTGKACQIIADHPGDCEPFFDVSVPTGKACQIIADHPGDCEPCFDSLKRRLPSLKNSAIEPDFGKLAIEPDFGKVCSDKQKFARLLPSTSCSDLGGPSDVDDHCCSEDDLTCGVPITSGDEDENYSRTRIF